MLDGGNGNGRFPLPAASTLTEELPPQNLEAERWLLGGLLLAPEKLPEVMEVVSADDLYRDAHQVIFRAMVDLWQAGIGIDVVTLSDRLERRGQYKQIGGDDLMMEITSSVPHAANVVFHAQVIRQKSIARQIQSRSTETIREIYSGLFTADQVLERARVRLADLQPSGGEPWPDLSFQSLPEVLPFPVDVFPVALARYCRGVAQVTLSPADLAGAAMLATASAAIGQSVNIRVKRTWLESPLLYLLIVADPGRTKTPPMKLVVNPLTRLDIRLRKESERRRRDWEESKRVAVKGMSPVQEPAHLRAVVKDITRETLSMILRDNPHGVLADPDEATGWVGSFNEYKGRGTDRQFWLDVWGGRAISVDREGGRRSCWVANPLVTVLGGLPPDMIGCLVEEQGRNDGFFDRILFSFPDKFPGQEWTEDELDDGDELTWSAIVERLHGTAMFLDEEKGDVRPHLVGFDVAGKKRWVEWFNCHCKEMESDEGDAWRSGAWSKLRAYCARFCLILSRLRLAMDPERPDLHRGEIWARDVDGAVMLVDYFKSHLAKVYHRRNLGLGSDDARCILAWIKRHGRALFTERDIRRDLRRFDEAGGLVVALKILVEANAIRPKIEVLERRRAGRKPSPSYEVHPALCT